MGRISEIMLLQQTEQPVLLIEKNIPVTELPQAIGESFMNIDTYLKEFNMLPTDVPFIGYPDYKNATPENVHVITGIKTPVPLPAKDAMQSLILPKGRIVTTLYQGPFEEIESVYTEVEEWIKTKGYKVTGSTKEYYYTGPDTPASKQITRIELGIV